MIYSDVAVSLQAVVLPAEALMYLNKLTRDESLYCFPCVTSRLSPLVSRIQISITPPFSSLSHLLAAIISRSVSSLCYVSFSPPRSQCVAATVSASSGSGSAEKLTKAATPGFAGPISS